MLSERHPGEGRDPISKRILGPGLRRGDDYPLRLMRPWRRARAFFVDHFAALETIERERSIQVVRLAARDGVGVQPSRCRSCLESSVAPSARHAEAFHGKQADNGTSVHAHVAYPAPGAHHL